MIEVEDQGPVRKITMARGKGNAVNLELIEAIGAALEAAEQSPAQAIVLTGQGSSFCAGVDLLAATSGGAEYLEAFLPALSKTLSRLAMLPKPVVAAVNGHAIAGGCILMLACDLKVVARGGAKIGLTELAVGVPFPTWALEIARHRISTARLGAMIYTAKTISVDEAYHQGLADELVDPDELLARACQLARQLATIPAETFRLVKTQMNRPLCESVARTIDSDDPEVVRRWCAPESIAQIQTFVQQTFKR